MITLVLLFAFMLWNVSARLSRETEAADVIRKALRQSEERKQFALEACQIGAWDLDLTDHTAYRSPEHDRIFGYDRLLPQWTLDDFFRHALPEYHARIKATVEAATAARKGWTFECPIRRADGEIRWIFFTGHHYTDSSGHNRVAGVVQDITENKQAEEALKASLAEKGILLRELSHRTKNNMQVIAGLISLQAATFSDGKMLSALSDTQYRIRAMALVHEKLHRSGNFSSLNVREYIEDLLRSILNAHHGTAGRVRTDTDLDDDFISIDSALPLGLIINELVSNSLKHAFPDRKSGTIKLSLKVAGERTGLKYRDDGPGLPPDFDLSRIGSLGLKLVNNLAVLQLGGTMEIRHGSDTEFVFTFGDLTQKKGEYSRV